MNQLLNQLYLNIFQMNMLSTTRLYNLNYCSNRTLISKIMQDLLLMTAVFDLRKIYTFPLQEFLKNILMWIMLTL